MIEKFVVTGGGGFVGSALCRSLKSRGADPVALGRRAYPELEQHGVKTVQGDIGDSASRLAEIFAGATAVFHTAAYVKMWGNRADFYHTNVIGTRNVLEACRLAGVKFLIFTSSPSVVAGGSLRGINERYPYPTKYEALYPETKAQAEREVLAAHGERLRTIALRPHLIFGPGDTNLIPTIVARAKEGRLVRIGAGNNLVDFSFIEDCVAAHLNAFDALRFKSEVGGKPYFISQGDPFPLWEFVEVVLRAHGIPPLTRSVSFRTAHALAGVFEFFAKALPGKREPRFTRFLVSEMATDHYFDITAARTALGYLPSYTVREALLRTFPKLDS